MTKEEVLYLRDTIKSYPKQDEIWRKAFQVYNLENPDRMMIINCRPCFDKVYSYFKQQVNANPSV